MYDAVLIPTDGSETAAAAVREGVGLAALSGATVHGLYVVDTRDYNTLSESKWLSLEAGLEAEAEAALSALEDAAEAAGVDVTTAVRRGVPQTEILAYADDHDVDVVVMGTHGRTGLDRVLLGSVAESVLRQASTPVHVVRAGEGDDGG